MSVVINVLQLITDVRIIALVINIYSLTEDHVLGRTWGGGVPLLHSEL